MNRKFEFYCGVLKRTVTEDECAEILSGNEIRLTEDSPEECDDCIAYIEAFGKAASDTLREIYGKDDRFNYCNEGGGVIITLHKNLVVDILSYEPASGVSFFVDCCKYGSLEYEIERKNFIPEVKKWIDGKKIVILKFSLGEMKSIVTDVIDRDELRINPDKYLKGISVKIIDNTGIYTKKEYLGK